MSWSYRSDNSDAVYSSQPGPTVVSGGKAQAEAPASATGDAQGTDLTVYTADGAIAVRNHTAVISKAGSAAAMTLAAPTAAQNGMRVVLVAGTAFAHVITATGLIDDGVTGGAKNAVTLGAFVGASATLMAYNLHWVLVAKTVATVA